MSAPVPHGGGGRRRAWSGVEQVLESAREQVLQSLEVLDPKAEGRTTPPPARLGL